ncbi:MAG TPA: hypothetical protein VFV93_10125 [Thermomicrobiales bacterium]|nr:hypothetical protein [Thermomicrobiales bacterium]
MRFDIFTIFPGIFSGPFDESIVRRAIDRGLLEIALHDIREHGLGRHRAVDDTPYGGGAGMVMAAPPLFASIETALGDALAETPVMLMSPSGEPFTQQIARELSELPRLALVCGRYEGVDQRVRDHLITRELSIGDYVLTGGELAAAVIVEVVPVPTMTGVRPAICCIVSAACCSRSLRFMCMNSPVVARMNNPWTPDSIRKSW